jgi:hypothetical protein
MSSLSDIMKQTLLIGIDSSSKTLRILLTFFIQTRGACFNLYNALNNRHTRNFPVSEYCSYMIGCLT